MVSDTPFLVDDWWVDPRAHRMVHRGVERRLEPKVMALLVRLAETAGRSVTRADLMASIWPDTVVSDDALNRVVSQLRKAFDDDADQQGVIRTVPTVGYRLVASVSTASAVQSSEPSDSVQSNEAPSRSSAFHTERPPWLIAVGVLVLVILIGVSSALDAGEAREESRTVRPVTNYKGLEVHPAVEKGAQDNRIAYAWQGEKGDNWDIYMNVVDAGQPIRLTNHPARDIMPAWSPDGQHIIFVRLSGTSCSIRVVPSSGGGDRSLDACASVTDLAWHPDGSRVFVAESPGPSAPGRIRELNISNGHSRVVTEPPEGTPGDIFLAASPDGRQLAFARSRAPGAMNLYRMPLDGSTPVRLTQEHAKIHGLDWTADGDAIVYSSNRGHGSFDLWSVPWTGGEPSGFLVGPAEIDAPSVGTSGRHVAFEVWSTRTSLYASNTDGAEPDRITNANAVDWHPDTAPDGNQTVFTSNRSGFAQLWRTDTDGSNPVQLTHLEAAYVTAPRWSPDGKRIVFEARPDGQGEIYIVEDDKALPRRITGHEAEDRYPGWSSDGAWIYFASNRSGDWQVWKIPVDGGEPVQVTTEGGYVATEDTGGRLVLTRPDRTGLWLYREDIDTYDLLTDALQPVDARNWTTAGRNIVFVSRDSDESADILRMDPEGRFDSLMTDVEALYYKSGLATSDEGSRVVFSRIVEHDSDIHVLRFENQP